MRRTGCRPFPCRGFPEGRCPVAYRRSGGGPHALCGGRVTRWDRLFPSSIRCRRTCYRFRPIRDQPRGGSMSGIRPVLIPTGPVSSLILVDRVSSLILADRVSSLILAGPVWSLILAGPVSSLILAGLISRWPGVVPRSIPSHHRRIHERSGIRTVTCHRPGALASCRLGLAHVGGSGLSLGRRARTADGGPDERLVRRRGVGRGSATGPAGRCSEAVPIVLLG